MTETSALDYVVRNFPAYEDPQLEALRQAALQELSEIRAFAVGRLYRGTFIYKLPTGDVFVLGENGRKYDFLTGSEAEAFIDASLVISGLLIGVLARWQRIASGFSQQRTGQSCCVSWPSFAKGMPWMGQL